MPYPFVIDDPIVEFNAAVLSDDAKRAAEHARKAWRSQFLRGYLGGIGRWNPDGPEEPDLPVPPRWRTGTDISPLLGAIIQQLGDPYPQPSIIFDADIRRGALKDVREQLARATEQIDEALKAG